MADGSGPVWVYDTGMDTITAMPIVANDIQASVSTNIPVAPHAGASTTV